MNLPTRRYPRSAARGFTLTEILFVVILAGFVLLISARIFTSVMRTIWATSDNENGVARFDAMTLALRADVWRSRDVSIPDAQTAVLKMPDGPDITWRFAADGMAIRTIAAGATMPANVGGAAAAAQPPPATAATAGQVTEARDRQWPVSGWTSHFELRPMGLRLHIDRPGEAALDLDFQSVQKRLTGATAGGRP